MNISITLTPELHHKINKDQGRMMLDLITDLGNVVDLDKFKETASRIMTASITDEEYQQIIAIENIDKVMIVKEV